jgi:hypothetical protein
MKLSVKQIVASVAGAVIAALALSFLGVGGTIIGVALGSAAATITSALAFHSLEAGHQKVKEIVKDQPLGTVPSQPSAPPAPPTLGAPVLSASDWSREGPAIAAPPSVAPLPPASPRGVRWPVIAVIGLVFVLALSVVTVVELAVGKPLSTVVKGGPAPANKTSVGDVFSGRTATTVSTTTSTVRPATTTTGRPATSTTTSSTTTSTVPATSSTTTTSTSTTTPSAALRSP